MDKPWDLLNKLFDQASDLPPDQREAFIVSELPDQVELQAQLRRLLSISADPNALIGDAAEYSFLNLRRIGVKLPADLYPTSTDVGQTLGVYELLELAGEGGMGRVYRARHTESNEIVAVKVLRTDVNSRRLAEQRFDIERRLLAALQHPHIAKLLDVGSVDDGRHYLVMEFVDGPRITEYCQTNQLSVDGVLRLFQMVLSAVAHAHSYGIVHRDLKPSNILVNSAEFPKLVDFGVAKVVTAVVVEEFTTLTVDGAVAITPEYATSPEQLSGRPANMASDIYSLGTILYEMVTGVRPFAFDTRSPLEIAHVICNETAPKPSFMLAAAEASRDAATRTRRKQLLGDVDAIIMKAMRKEPEQRYRSAAEFSDDINRYLDGHPVQARKDQRAYVARRFVRRHKVSVMASMMLLLTLVVAFVVTNR
ncbi:MAG: serine/threonine protein kinase, partial [Planctomycetales bacterium]|nr:serine/threonine protein kinase [Planctomycetales bacterium]